MSARCNDLPPGTYEWTVQSSGINGQAGGISAIGTFTRATYAIAAPALLSPSTNATLDYPDNLGDLHWAPAAGAELYQWQMSASPSFAEGEPDLQYSFAATDSPIWPEFIGVKQYWRVRGVNAARTWAGPWSATGSFTVTWPDLPMQLLPADGASASNIVMSTTPVKGATDYEFEITTVGDTDFSEATRTTPTSPGTYLLWGAVPAEDLRWRVRARNGGGTTAWSPARTIHRDAGAPSVPVPDPVAPPHVTLSSPADGATLPSSSDVLLSWTPIAGALGYEFDYRTSSGPWINARVIVGWPPLRWHFAPGETYVWRIRSVGEGGAKGSWSDEWELTIDDPLTLTLLGPSAGADVPASSAGVSWQAVPGSMNYTIETSEDADLETWGISTWSTTTAAELIVPHAGRWYWRVRAGLSETDALSAPRAIDVLDDTPPSGRIGFSSEWTAQPSTTVGLEAHDGLGMVVEAQLSADGATWESFSMPEWGSREVAWSLTSPAHGGSNPGQRHIHARFRDDSGNWSPVLSASTWYGMEPPLDETPPSGTISIANGAAYTKTRLPVIDIPATDVHGVTRIALSTDGVNWVERPYWPKQQVTLPATNGTKTVYVKWLDSKLNWSASKSDTIVLDNVAPNATAPSRTFVSGSTVTSDATSTKFSWSGSDATSGIARYEAAISTDGGTYSTISTALTSATLARALTSGHSYQLRVRAVDKAGNFGAWMVGATFTVTAYQETSSRFTRTGTWKTAAHSSYWGGHERYATAAGAKFSFTTSSRNVAWIGSVGPARGSAKIYVNGVLFKTVSTYAATTVPRRVLASLSWSTTASRRITIVVSGTAGHARVDLDAFVTGS